MPVTLVGTAGPAFALPAAELFVDAESVTLDVSPQFIKEKTSYDGIINNVAYGPMEASLSISGKTKIRNVNGPYTGSLLLSVLGTAFSPATTYTTLNAGTSTFSITAIWGAPTTGMYLEKGSLSYGEGDYVGFACDFKARAGIT
jgi:hypothetical protein